MMVSPSKSIPSPSQSAITPPASASKTLSIWLTISTKPQSVSPEGKHSFVTVTQYEPVALMTN